MLTDATDNLQGTLSALGASNATIRPAIFFDAPMTLTIGTFSATATVGFQYTAKINTSGTAQYAFLKKGRTVSGSFLITKFSAVEQGQSSATAHTYMIQGELTRPNGLKYKPSPTGQFTFQIGNSVLSIPAGQFIGDGKGNLKFKARAGVSGLKQFQIQAKSGAFKLQVNGLPALGNGATGLPVSSGNDITNVDLNLSLQFDLSDGHLDAGRYIFITRKSATAKTWVLR